MNWFVGDLVSAEDQLLVLLSLSDLTEEEKAQAQAAVDKVTSWQKVYELGQENATTTLLYLNLKKYGWLEAVPADVLKKFEKQANKIEEANEARLKVARKLMQKFADRNIPCVILKGVLFGETIYKNPYYKKMNDLDILIRMDDLDAIYEVYEELEFFSAAELLGGKEKDPRKQEKFSHHCPPFFSRDLKCMIGTHWGLITPMAPYNLDYDAIWSRVVDIEFQGIPAKSMAPEDNLHHLCVHLPYYKTGVRELADIYNLVREYREEIDWELFLNEVEKADTQNLVYHALSLVNRILPMPECLEVARRIEPQVSWYFRNDTQRKTQNIERLLTSRSVHMSRIEKAYSDFSTTKDPKEMASAYGRMWKNILLVPKEDVAKMNAIFEQNFGMPLAQVITPWRIFRVFARDLGATIFIALMAKCLADLIKQTFLTIIGQGGSEQDFAAFAEKIGVSVADLEQLKEGLE